jgi:hypothetical protein
LDPANRGRFCLFSKVEPQKYVFYSPQSCIEVVTFSIKLCSIFSGKINDLGPEQSIVVNMPSYFSRAALDAIGEGMIVLLLWERCLTSSVSAAFDYNFGALKDADNDLARSFADLL